MRTVVKFDHEARLHSLRLAEYKIDVLGLNAILVRLSFAGSSRHQEQVAKPNLREDNVPSADYLPQHAIERALGL